MGNLYLEKESWEFYHSAGHTYCLNELIYMQQQRLKPNMWKAVVELCCTQTKYDIMSPKLTDKWMEWNSSCPFLSPSKCSFSLFCLLRQCLLRPQLDHSQTLDNLCCIKLNVIHEEKRSRTKHRHWGRHARKIHFDSFLQSLQCDMIYKIQGRTNSQTLCCYRDCELLQIMNIGDLEIGKSMAAPRTMQTCSTDLSFNPFSKYMLSRFDSCQAGSSLTKDCS